MLQNKWMKAWRRQRIEIDDTKPHVLDVHSSMLNVKLMLTLHKNKQHWKVNCLCTWLSRPSSWVSENPFCVRACCLAFLKQRKHDSIIHRRLVYFLNTLPCKSWGRKQEKRQLRRSVPYRSQHSMCSQWYYCSQIYWLTRSLKIVQTQWVKRMLTQTQMWWRQQNVELKHIYDSEDDGECDALSISRFCIKMTGVSNGETGTVEGLG